jgi:2-polyprenyl-3-methyl-5-hydroxy-6-metoxy-1,4-benzoquinol methylase
MAQITTEITSSQIASDNPIHQRLLYAYQAAVPFIEGKVLEVGCGEGRGLETIQAACAHYTALDKNTFLLERLQAQYPSFKFLEMTFPPFTGIPDQSFDTVVVFQVIEHIQNDQLFVSEIHRVLKPGGKVLLTTPNIWMSLTRNPWHEREYTANQLKTLLLQSFSKVDCKGVLGNQKVMDYYELNKKSVQKITRFDIFDLQHKLPNWILRTPYDFFNRLSRNRMLSQADRLVSDISTDDFYLTEEADKAFDFFYIATK